MLGEVRDVPVELVVADCREVDAGLRGGGEVRHAAGGARQRSALREVAGVGRDRRLAGAPRPRRPRPPGAAGARDDGASPPKLMALDWGDLDLDGPRPSPLVRCGKGGEPGRQALAPAMARELIPLRARTRPAATERVFRGLGGGRPRSGTESPTIPANRHRSKPCGH